MKWITLTFGFISLVTACVVNEQTLSCPTKTIDNIVANFDDRQTGENLTYYQHLNFNNIGVEQQGDFGSYQRQVIPHSLPNYGIPSYNNNNTTQFGPGLLLSINGTKTTSFDFHSAWVGCIDASNIRSGYEAERCTIAIDCVTVFSMEGHVGQQVINYVPDNVVGAQMMEAVASEPFTYCSQVSIQILEAPVNVTLLVDDVNYTIREGECLPLCYGCPNPNPNCNACSSV